MSYECGSFVVPLLSIFLKKCEIALRQPAFGTVPSNGITAGRLNSQRYIRKHIAKKVFSKGNTVLQDNASSRH